MAKLSAAAAVLLYVMIFSLAVDAVRNHTEFAANTYYSSDGSKQEVPLRKEDSSPLPDSGEKPATIPNRYETGYPSNRQYNTVPGSDEKNDSVTELAERYPHGYYPNSQYTNGGTKLPPSQTTGTTSYAQEETKQTTNGTIPDRYPHGYYPNSQYTNGDTKLPPSQTTGTTSYAQEVTNETANSTVPDRYPHGYYPNSQYTNGDKLPPSQTSGTTSYAQEVTNQTANGTTPDRYPHGYYPNSQYSNGDSKLPPSQTSGTTSYAQGVNSPSANGTIPDRYPQGYYPASKQVGNEVSHAQYYSGAHYSTSSSNYQQQSSDVPTGRYPHGYYTNSQYSAGANYQASGVQKPQTTGVQNYNAGSYASQSANPAGERYPHGYYPNSQYVQQQSNSVSYSQSTSNSASSSQSAPQGRYPTGYYGQSGISAAKQVSYSYEGNFNTLPYPNNAGELPYDEAGQGCRTAYWADNVWKWPHFFTAQSTVEDAFGSQAKQIYGETTILEALVRYGNDPYSELLRAACTAILNSYARGAYKIPHMMVIEEFNAALVSKEAAASQAQVFEAANVESISSGNACS